MNDRPDLTIEYLVVNEEFSNIDELGVFSIALSATDIEFIMNAGLEEATGIASVYPADKLATTWGNLK